jgi:hypothetical protein
MPAEIWASFAFDWIPARTTLQYALREGAKQPDSLSFW